jgi:hypothetical protein
VEAMALLAQRVTVTEDGATATTIPQTATVAMCKQPTAVESIRHMLGDVMRVPAAMQLQHTHLQS